MRMKRPSRSSYVLPWLAGGIIVSAMAFSSAVASTGGLAAPNDQAKRQANNGGLAAPREKSSMKTDDCLWRQNFLTTTYGPPWDEIEGGPETAIGTPLRPGRFVVAVDRNLIPLGSKLRVWPNPHNYRGLFTAEDVGGAIIGKHIDIYVWQGRQVRDFWRNPRTKICLVSRGDIS